MLDVSPSEIARFKRCRRSWYLTYHQRWAVDPDRAPATSVTLLGTRIHAALEAHYGYAIDPLAALRAVYAAEKGSRPDAAAELDHEHEYAHIMVAGYLDWAAETGIDEEYDVIEAESTVESAFTLDDGTIAVVSGKLDQITRRRLDNAQVLRDFKTVGTLHKADHLVLDEQFRTYAVLLERSRGDTVRIDGGLYAMLRRSKQTARATGPHYEQVHISYNRHEYDSMVLRLRGVLTDMHHVTMQLDAGVDHRLVAYPTPILDRCGWDCPFVHICPMFDDGSRVDAALRDNFIRRDPYAYRDNGLLETIRAACAGTGEEQP